MAFITKEGFKFGFDPEACKACKGRCCTGKTGHVWLKEKDIEAISDRLALDVDTFVMEYLVRIHNRFSLKELKIKGQCDCVLLDSRTKRCSVYDVRPEQCRTYPFWNCFKKNPQVAINECPGAKPLVRMP
jgi:Fe-S-cluster containining protein